jgi:hypothetical protein
MNTAVAAATFASMALNGMRGKRRAVYWLFESGVPSQG